MNPAPHLRPMTVGDILDEAISLYRKNFVLFIGIVAVVSVPLLFVQILNSIVTLINNPLLIDPNAFDPRDLNDFQSAFGSIFLVGVVGGCVFVVITLITNALQTAALASAISERYLGHELTIRQAYRRSWRVWKSLVGASLIQFIVYLPVALLFIVPCIGWVGAPIVFVALLVRWLFHAQAIALENLSAADGLRRSWQLVTGMSWRVLGIALMAGLMVFIAQFIVAFAIQAGLGLVITTTTTTTRIIASVIENVFISLLNLLLTPIMLTVLTLLYYDLRIRKEGFDLEVMARQLGASSADASTTL